jgi:hypothetical protein
MAMLAFFLLAMAASSAAFPNLTVGVVIFSKDRACQLDQFITSAKKLFPDVLTHASVLFTNSTPAFGRGYDRVKKIHPDVRFISQSEPIKAHVLDLLSPAHPLTTFFVDDIVFTAKVNSTDPKFYQLLSDKDILALSLRLHPGVTHCYATDEHTPPPPLDPNGRWFWRGAPGDWGYPLSLDGHVIRTDVILPLIRAATFATPNELEFRMAQAAPPSLRFMTSFQRPRLLNVPANRVQTFFPNRHASSAAPHFLNNEFVIGRRLAFDHFLNRAWPSVHVAEPLAFRVGARDDSKEPPLDDADEN